jgi:hypothetical protein
MAQFTEVVDEIQISMNPSSIEQVQRPSNPTIISKFRSKLDCQSIVRANKF